MILTQPVILLPPAHPSTTLCSVGLEFSFHETQTRGTGKKVTGKKGNDIQLLAAVSFDPYCPGSSPVIFFHVTLQCIRIFSIFMIFSPARMFAAFFLGPYPTETTFFQHQLFIDPKVPGFPNLNCPCTEEKYVITLERLKCLKNSLYKLFSESDSEKNKEYTKFLMKEKYKHCAAPS